ncbi:hypothetical protein R4K89_01190 [Brachyspira intermedia]|uniref:hypothetical protein n=1 Tax=Brachyspira intermedia TaxID=84377 RepID=UPI003004FEA3
MYYLFLYSCYLYKYIYNYINNYSIRGLNMKLYYVLFSFLIILVVSCTKNTGVVVTNPGPDIVLNKIRYGNFKGVTINADNVLTITGSTKGNNGTYRFVGYDLTISADFVKINDEGKNLQVVPSGKSVLVVSTTQSAMDFMDKIRKSDNTEYKKIATNMLGQLMKTGSIDTTKTDELLKGVNLSESERNQITNELLSLKDDFFTEVIK